MKAPKKRISKQKFSKLNYYVFGVLFTLALLTSANIYSYVYSKPKDVLGVSDNNFEGIFWYNFLKEHPNYIPGWIEIGRPDKAMSLDPNFF